MPNLIGVDHYKSHVHVIYDIAMAETSKAVIIKSHQGPAHDSMIHVICRVAKLAICKVEAETNSITLCQGRLSRFATAQSRLLPRLSWNDAGAKCPNVALGMISGR